MAPYPNLKIFTKLFGFALDNRGKQAERGLTPAQPEKTGANRPTTLGRACGQGGRQNGPLPEEGGPESGRCANETAGAAAKDLNF